MTPSLTSLYNICPSSVFSFQCIPSMDIWRVQWILGSLHHFSPCLPQNNCKPLQINPAVSNPRVSCTPASWRVWFVVFIDGVTLQGNVVPQLTWVGAQVSQDLTKGAEFEKHTSVPNILAFSWKLILLGLNILQVLRCSGILGRMKIFLKRFDSNHSYWFFFCCCCVFVFNLLLNGILLSHQPGLIGLCDIIPEVQQWESPITTHLQAIKRSEGNAS